MRGLSAAVRRDSRRRWPPRIEKQIRLRAADAKASRKTTGGSIGARRGAHRVACEDCRRPFWQRLLLARSKLLSMVEKCAKRYKVKGTPSLAQTLVVVQMLRALRGVRFCVGESSRVDYAAAPSYCEIQGQAGLHTNLLLVPQNEAIGTV